MFEILDQETLGIIATTMRMTITSTAISAILGIPFGLFLESVRPTHWLPRFLKWLTVSINRTLMGTPPVVAGLVVFLLFMRNGPFGALRLLYTFEIMVIAQVLLVTPIISGIVYTAATRHGDRIRAFARTMGASRLQTRLLLLKELGNEIFFATITGFGRAMSEVGAIVMVGGNIRHHTRVMTGTIMLDVNRGFRDQAIQLGIILMLIAFTVQIIADILRRRERRLDENF
ncbi:MAG: ABC transporter permease [Defluviitaleaceae bacterium]|nr:ABC transporter permease [Defluviitaleaceae bacterium]